jgi:hypothetical protein
VSCEIEFRRETLPPLAALEREWRALEAVAYPSFFTSWQWIGTLLAAVPPERRPNLLRGVARGETVALALLGAGVARRRHGLVRSRALYLNQTGDPRFDSIMIEHNGILAAAGREAAAFDGAIAWFTGLAKEADEFYLNGSLAHFSKAAGSAGASTLFRPIPSSLISCRPMTASSIRCSAPTRASSCDGRFGISNAGAACS